MEGPELLIPSSDDPERIHPGTGFPIWHHYGIDTNARKYPHNVFPSSVTGIPGHPVLDVLLEKIEIIYEGGSERTVNDIGPDEAETRIPEAVASYPEFSMFGELPAWGIFSRHVEGLRLRDVRILTKQPDHRMPLLFMDTKGPELRGMRVNDRSVRLSELESPIPHHYRLRTWNP
jgi:hypothetical protein